MLSALIIGLKFCIQIPFTYLHNALTALSAISYLCRPYLAQSSGTSGVVKACDPSRTVVHRKGVLGEDLPWPLPDVNSFVSRGSKRTSIFVLPQVYVLILHVAQLNELWLCLKNTSEVGQNWWPEGSLPTQLLHDR